MFYLFTEFGINIKTWMHLFLIGIFLGYSILQLLEFGVAIINIPIKRVHDYLRDRTEDLEQEMQFQSQQTDDDQAEAVNLEEYHQEIKLDRNRTGSDVADLANEIKVLVQDMAEMKIRKDISAIVEDIKVLKEDMTEIKEQIDR